MTDNFYQQAKSTIGRKRGEEQSYAELLADILKKGAKEGGIAFFGQLGGKAFGFLFAIIFARSLGPANYGLYTLGMMIIGVAKEISQLGLHKGLLRFIPDYQATGDKAKVKGTLSTTLGIPFLLSFAMAITLFLSSKYIALTVFHKPQLSLVLKILSLGLPFLVSSSMFSFALQGFQRISFKIATTLSLQITKLVIVGAFLLGGVSSLIILSGVTISAVLTALFGFYLLIRIIGNEIFSCQPKYQVKKLLRFSLPLYLAGFSYLFLTRADIYMLGYFTSAVDVGVYSAAIRFSMLVPFVLVALNTVFEPMIFNLSSREKYDLLEKTFKTFTRWTVLLTLPGVLAILIFGKPLLAIFGAEFFSGWIYLIILTIGQFANASVGAVGLILQMTDKHDISAIDTFFLCILNIVLNFWLISMYGPLGAAIATTASIGIVNLIMVFQVYKFHGFHPYNVKYLKIVLAGVIAVTVTYMGKLATFPWLGNLFLLFGSYFFVLYLVGLEKEEKLVLKAIKARITASQ